MDIQTVQKFDLILVGFYLCLLFSVVYKITDFGSSRDLLGEDRSKALYGTEEYLVSNLVSDNGVYFVVDKSILILFLFYMLIFRL